MMNFYSNYSFIIHPFQNNLESFSLLAGTYEKVEEEEEEIYEVINVHKLKSATPNLRVINLYGINFIDDSHIDAFSSNCIQVITKWASSMRNQGFAFCAVKTKNACIIRECNEHGFHARYVAYLAPWPWSASIGTTYCETENTNRGHAKYNKFTLF